MNSKSNKINELINLENKDIIQELSYFKTLLSDATLLNNFGVLKGNDFFDQIVDLVGIDEIFNDENLKYERERLISNIYLDKKTNKLYKNIINQLPLDFIDDVHQIGNLSKVEIEKLRLEFYYNEVSNFLIQYTSNLEKIRFEYDLKSIDKKINNRISILFDSKISLYSPLLFNQGQWEKIVINEFMLSDSVEEIEYKKKKFLENLIELELLLPSNFKNLPLIDVNETSYWLNYWYEEKSLFIYPIHFWLGSKKYFLESLSSSKLKRLFNKELIKRYNEAEKTVKKLKNQLKRSKIEVKHERFLKSIIQGMAYLLSKGNSNFSKKEILQIAKNLIANLFYSSIIEPKETIINPSIKIDNTVLIEYIIFIRDKKQYLKNKKNSIPRLISENLNYNSKGFSYQNLNKIYKTTLTKGVINFNGLTSVKALSNEMKMRNY